MLENGRLSLLNKAQDPAFKPSQQEEALRCAETIELFTKSANIFNSGGFSASIPDTFTKVSIEGTEVSIQPDLLIGSKFPPDSDKKAGLVFFRPQKRPDPSTAKQDETRLARENYRRETAKYILALGYILFENQGLTPSQIDKKKMRVWDFRLGEAIDFPSDFLTRRKRIISACRQIANLWGSIPPRPSDLL